MATCLTDVQRKARKVGNAVNDIARSTGKEVSDMIGTMLCAYEDDVVGEVGASAAA